MGFGVQNETALVNQKQDIYKIKKKDKKKTFQKNIYISLQPQINVLRFNCLVPTLCCEIF